MHILRLTSNGDEGQIINYIDSCLWVERYFGAGEFEIKSKKVNYMLKELPIDSFISHVDTQEIMIVETHEIEEDEYEEPVITISGRSYLYVMMENRVVTRNGGIPPAQGHLGIPGRGYLLTGASDWNYARMLMIAYLQDPVEDASHKLNNVRILSEITQSDPEFKIYGFANLPTLLEAVTEIIDGDNIGIRCERPSLSNHPTIDFIIYKGIDRSPSIQFSVILGDVKKAKYLWSSIGYKNDGFVMAEGATYRMPSSSLNNHRARVGVIDASDLVYEFSNPPTGPERVIAAQQMHARGLKGLARMKKQQLIDAEIGNNPRYIYGQDYKLGDVVKIIGNYDMTQKMRVTEFATSFDDQGISKYPTLSAL